MTDSDDTKTIQTLCDTFVMTTKLVASDITYLDHHWREDSDLFGAWKFERHPNLTPPPETEEDEEMMECGFTSSQCWVYDLIEPHVDNAAMVIVAMSVFHLLDSVDAFAPEFKLPDLVEVPRTALGALIEGLSTMEPRAREWIWQGTRSEFAFAPEMNLLPARLRRGPLRLSLQPRPPAGISTHANVAKQTPCK
jgi:hypothetical protein